MQIKPDCQLEQIQFPSVVLYRSPSGEYYQQVFLDPFQSLPSFQVHVSNSLTTCSEVPVYFPVNPFYFLMAEIRTDSYVESEDLIYKLQQYKVSALPDWFDKRDSFVKFNLELFTSDLKRRQYQLEKLIGKNNSLLFLEQFVKRTFIEKNFGKIIERGKNGSKKRQKRCENGAKGEKGDRCGQRNARRTNQNQIKVRTIYKRRFKQKLLDAFKNNIIIFFVSTTKLVQVYQFQQINTVVNIMMYLLDYY
ncbi:Hypothetical_protein [Hexamita inflata]|uniref:Hypothetical_protein n=1 Tax=Hexamita inflata TaxID=28002 RepID=A0AA86RGG0_9EUKA|nr:Hypothetical protein HINF_LOCUS65166 [Hexamita inflata]